MEIVEIAIFGGNGFISGEKNDLKPLPIDWRARTASTIKNQLALIGQ